jgi:OmpA-OmpF porin, OOP family
MRSSRHLLRVLPLSVALTCGAAFAQQTQDPSSSGSVSSSGAFTRADGYSILPWTRRGYVGINLGRSDYGDFSCGTPGFGCDDTGTRLHLYTGGKFNEWLGMEVGYLNEGKVSRAGGSTRSDGVNLSLVGHLPVNAFHLFAKAGATYGRTRVSADALSGITSGSRRGWGGSYALGAGFDFTPSSGVVLEWSRNAFVQPGGGRNDVDGTSIGYVHRF